MARTARVALLVAFTLVAAACAAGGTAGGPRRDPNSLTAEDFADPAILSLSALDAIQRLRPNWLRARQAASAAFRGDVLPALMVNEGPQPFEALTGLRASDLTSARYISGPDATTMYGTGFVNGLIKLTTGGMR